MSWGGPAAATKIPTWKTTLKRPTLGADFLGGNALTKSVDEDTSDRRRHQFLGVKEKK